ncbi:MAG TPA: cytochrome c, partial [Longimicrobiales bacterium]
MRRIVSRAVSAWTAFTMVPVLATSTAADLGGQEPGSGEWLYTARGCLGCHGASAHGGVGPTLARTALAFDDFVAQVREPRGIMPDFPAAVVSDAELRAIFDYVGALGTVSPRLRRDVPTGEQSAASCAECHATLNPVIVRQFAGSAMGLPGVQNTRVDFPQPQLTCADCHGTDHSVITASKGRVSETRCAACHPAIYQEHV